MEQTVSAPRNGFRYQVLAYLRVSNDLQQDNHTFETQEQRIREKLDSCYGVDRYDIKMYKDDGLSGAFGPESSGIEKRTRPSLKALERDIKSGMYDCLAVYNTGRWFRSTRWLFQYLEDVIDPSGVDFISATENIDIKSPEGRAMLGVLSVINAAYRENCVQRNRDAIAGRLEAGFNVGPPPYGWQYEPRQEQYAARRRGIVRNPAHEEHLIFMKDRYLAGHGGSQIAGELNLKGIKSSRGTLWDSKAVLKAIKNPIHAGLILSKKDQTLRQAQNYADRYWDRDTYEEVLQICERNKRYSRTNTAKPDSPDIFSGLISCARCGTRLYSMSGWKYRGYHCRKGRRQGEPTCSDVTIRADSIEDALVRELEQASRDPQIRQILASAAKAVTEAEDATLEKEQESLSKSLQNIKSRSDQLLDWLTRHVIDENRFKDADQELQQQEREIKHRIQEITKDLSSREHREAWARKIQQTILDFPLCWEHATLSERRHLILTLVEKLTIDRSGRDATVNLKIHLLAERQFAVCFESARHVKDRPIGVEGLTRRQLAFLHHVGLGRSYKEIAVVMGTGVANIYTLAMQIRRYLGIRDMQDAYRLARHRINGQMAFLPLGSSGRCKLKLNGPQAMNPSLREVLPLLARGASYTEVARRTGLTPAAVSARRKRILEILETKSMFEAGERARALGLLDDDPGSAPTLFQANNGGEVFVGLPFSPDSGSTARPNTTP